MAQVGKGKPSEKSALLSLFEFLATVGASLFAGAALYINVAEHPARIRLDPRSAALQWAASYKRATWLQAPLAVISFLAGITVWLLGGSAGWLIAAALIGSVVPFTFIAIMPTNRRLLESSHNIDPDNTRALLDRWNTLHGVRTILGITAAVTCLLLLVTR